MRTIAIIILTAFSTSQLSSPAYAQGLNPYQAATVDPTTQNVILQLPQLAPVQSLGFSNVIGCQADNMGMKTRSQPVMPDSWKTTAADLSTRFSSSSKLKDQLKDPTLLNTVFNTNIAGFSLNQSSQVNAFEALNGDCGGPMVDPEKLKDDISCSLEGTSKSKSSSYGSDSSGSGSNYLIKKGDGTYGFDAKRFGTRRDEMMRAIRNAQCHSLKQQLNMERATCLDGQMKAMKDQITTMEGQLLQSQRLAAQGETTLKAFRAELATQKFEMEKILGEEIPDPSKDDSEQALSVSFNGGGESTLVGLQRTLVADGGLETFTSEATGLELNIKNKIRQISGLDSALNSYRAELIGECLTKPGYLGKTYLCPNNPAPVSAAEFIACTAGVEARQVKPGSGIYEMGTRANFREMTRRAGAEAALGTILGRLGFQAQTENEPGSVQTMDANGNPVNNLLTNRTKVTTTRDYTLANGSVEDKINDAFSSIGSPDGGQGASSYPISPITSLETLKAEMARVTADPGVLSKINEFASACYSLAENQINDKKKQADFWYKKYQVEGENALKQQMDSYGAKFNKVAGWKSALYKAFQQVEPPSAPITACGNSQVNPNRIDQLNCYTRNFNKVEQIISGSSEESKFKFPPREIAAALSKVPTFTCQGLNNCVTAFRDQVNGVVQDRVKAEATRKSYVANANQIVDNAIAQANNMADQNSAAAQFTVLKNQMLEIQNSMNMGATRGGSGALTLNPFGPDSPGGSSDDSACKESLNPPLNTSDSAEGGKVFLKAPNLGQAIGCQVAGGLNMMSLKEGSLASAFNNIEPDPKKVLEQLIGGQGTSSKNLSLVGAMGVGGKFGDLMAKVAECEAMAKEKNSDEIEAAVTPFAKKLKAFFDGTCSNSRSACEKLNSEPHGNIIRTISSVLDQVVTGENDKDEESSIDLKCDKFKEIADDSKYSTTERSVNRKKYSTCLNSGSTSDRNISDMLISGMTCESDGDLADSDESPLLTFTTGDAGSVTSSTLSGKISKSDQKCVEQAQDLVNARGVALDRVNKLSKAAGIKATDAK